MAKGLAPHNICQGMTTSLFSNGKIEEGGVDESSEATTVRKHGDQEKERKKRGKQKGGRRGGCERYSELYS